MKKRLLATLATVTLALAGCANTVAVSASGGGKSSVDSADSHPDSSADSSVDFSAHAIDKPMPAIPAGLENYYGQSIDWESCGLSADCATIEVPLNYADPGGKRIELALKRRHADGDPIGSILVNPGGPGAGGKDMADAADGFFSDRILTNFDVIGFDPRGVGESTPIDCVSDSELDKELSVVYPDTPEGNKESNKAGEEMGAACVERSGDLVKYVGTEEAARDMDIIRHLVGDPQLYYVGFSYGTKLGGMYAELFPDNVGRMILDGAVDSTISDFEQNKAQLQGFEGAVNAYIDDCLGKSKCPFSGTREDARAEIRQMFDDARKTPIPTADPQRPLTQSGLLYGFITPLYDDTAWAFLSQAISEYQDDGTGTMFQLFFDTYTGRAPDGSYANNSVEAHMVINCADTVVDTDEKQWEEYNEQLKKESPLFGDMMGYSLSTCVALPKPEHKIINRFTATGSAPIVVVGTTGDPATPYKWAVSFEKAFDNAVLVTWEGEGHTAYGRASGPCVKDPLDRYLLNGTVPEDGLRCPGK